MFTFGSGSFGQLGNGSTTKITCPVPVYGLPEPIKSIYTAYFHNVSITQNFIVEIITIILKLKK